VFVSYSSFTYYTIANVFHEYADYISYLRFDGFATSPFIISRKWIFYTPYTAWSIHRRPCGSATFRGWAQQPPCLSVRTGMQMMRRGPGAASWVPARHPIRIPIYSRTESLSLSLSLSLASLARYSFLPSNKMEMSPLLTREAWARRDVRCVSGRAFIVPS